MRAEFVIAVLVAALGSGVVLAIPVHASRADAISRAGVHSRTNYGELGAGAVRVLERRYYTGSGTWNMCVPAICAQRNIDWGADSLTYALYFRWQLARERAARPIMAALARTASRYTAADGQWSDLPEWDAVADLREYQVTGDGAALTKAQAAFDLVESEDSAKFASGACPSIDYQRANGGKNHLKTLETDSNYIRAALLLHQVTGTRSYLAKARQKYQAVRKYFLSGRSALYTAHVFDRAGRCAQRRGLYYASVNGNMIWAGATLAQATGRRLYLVQATADHQKFARAWLIGAASAAAADRTA